MVRRTETSIVRELIYAAGLTLENVAGSKTAVYTASMADDYCRILSKDPDEAPQTTITGVSPAILANKLSWYFDLRGPSVHVDTACSSSMIAMDLACQSLRLGQSSMVISYRYVLDEAKLTTSLGHGCGL